MLAAECYECHGRKKQKGGLALDTREALRQGGDSGPAIEPGDPEKSLLIRSIRHTDPELKMPSKAPQLDPAVIADFEAWVKMGAPDPRTSALSAGPASWADTLAARRHWWCFQPLRPGSPPAVRDAAWSEHPIDRYLLARMESAGLAPAQDAEPRVLLRRLAFALTGLPPTPAETEEFVREAARDRGAAMAETVGRLLASPAFGECWARHWMDLARYAETFGSEHDYLNPHAWRYRDYLVRAFNDDLPYDRFVQEQIAGDLLPPRWNRELGINEALLATSWQRMTESYATPVDVKREEATAIDWQIEALGKTFLGLTVQCARCHDHKFDPISAKDYYAFYGVFASTRPAMCILDEPAKLTAHDAEIVKLKIELRAVLAARWQGAVEFERLPQMKELRAAADFTTAWRAMRTRETSPERGGTAFADFTHGTLEGWRASGPGLPEKPSPAGGLSLQPSEKFVRAIQPAGFYSDAVSERHGGSLRSPEFTIETQAVSVLCSGSGKARLRLVIDNFQNDLLLFSGVNPDLDSRAPRWVTMRMKKQWMGHRARLELLTRDDKTCVGWTGSQAEWEKSDGRSAFGIQRVVFHDGAAPAASSVLPAHLWAGEPKSAAEFAEQLSAATRAALASWAAGRASDEDARLLQALLECEALAAPPAGFPWPSRFRELEEKIPSATRAPGVCEDGYGRDAPLFPRGDHTHPEAPVPRRFLEVLGGAALPDRLALARELTRPDNPLVARVMANRVWQYLTGRGLVATPDNFGRMGERPTHPELLDHLAEELQKGGWSVKGLIRYIVSSRSWQLAAEPTDAAASADPANELLSHARLRRLDAEGIRDALLALGGNLHRGHSGPGVPVFYRTRIDPDKQPPAGPLDGAGCRSVYLEARRLFPSEWLSVFDAPRPNIFTGRRSETNVPAQSLALLNDPFVLHQAGEWGMRLVAGDATVDGRIGRAYREAFARAPSEEELAAARAFVARGQAEPWTDLAHALFNMKEFIYLR